MSFLIYLKWQVKQNYERSCPFLNSLEIKRPRINTCPRRLKYTQDCIGFILARFFKSLRIRQTLASSSHSAKYTNVGRVANLSDLRLKYILDDNWEYFILSKRYVWVLGHSPHYFFRKLTIFLAKTGWRFSFQKKYWILVMGEDTFLIYSKTSGSLYQ